MRSSGFRRAASTRRRSRPRRGRMTGAAGLKAPAYADDHRLIREDRMRTTLRWLCVLAIGAALQGGFFGIAAAQGPGPSPASPPPGYAGGVPDQAANPAGPTETEPATELPV